MERAVTTHSNGQPGAKPMLVVRRRLSPSRLATWLLSALPGRHSDGPWRYDMELVDREGRRVERYRSGSAEEAAVILAALGRHAASDSAKAARPSA